MSNISNGFIGTKDGDLIIVPRISYATDYYRKCKCQLNNKQHRYQVDYWTLCEIKSNVVYYENYAPSNCHLTIRDLDTKKDVLTVPTSPILIFRRINR